MVKRPLCPMLAAYIAGIYLAWQHFPSYYILLLLLIAYILIYLIMYGCSLKVKSRYEKLFNRYETAAKRYDNFLSRYIKGLSRNKSAVNRQKKALSRQDKFVWLLPFLFLAGFLSMRDRLKKPELYDSFGQEISCELSGEIAQIAESKYYISLYLKNCSVIIPYENSCVCEKIIVRDKDRKADFGSLGKYPYRIGNKIHADGKLKKFQTARNPGNFNEQLYYQIEGIFFYLDADEIAIIDSDYSPYHYILSSVKKRLTRIYSLMMSDNEAGTLAAMVLGEKSLLDEEQKRLYQENGISHILAISGLHIGLIAMFFFKLLRKLKCPIFPASILTMFFIYSYGILTGFSVSTNRAIVMMVISLLAPITGKCYDMLSSICLSALIILMQNPMQIISAGFLLSYGAVLGIAVVYPAIKQLFGESNPDKKAGKENGHIANAAGKNKSNESSMKKPYILTEFKDRLLSSVLISVSTQLTTVPVLLLFFYQLPVYSIIINLIILPLVTVLMLLAVLGAAAGLIYLPAGVFIIGGASYILKLYELICRIGSALPGNMLTVGRPGRTEMILYCICLCACLIILYRYKSKAALLVMAAGFLLLIYPKGNDGLLVTFLDVGQGDAIYMETKTGTAYLIDGGSSDVSKAGIYRIKPFLLSKGKDIIDYAIITHADKDHTSGLIEIINDGGIKVRHLILPDIAEKDESYIRLEELAQRNNIAVGYMDTGDSIRDGDILINCLHPNKGYKPANSNAYSIVLSLEYKNFSMLLTGDAEADGETMVIEQLLKGRFSGIDDIGLDYIDHIHGNDIPGYDILKVAHHGSRTSTSEEFLSYVRPRIAIISCGRDNKYGHPHKELLDRLEKADSQVEITYETGAVMIETDGENLEMERHLK